MHTGGIISMYLTKGCTQEKPREERVKVVQGKQLLTLLHGRVPVSYRSLLLKYYVQHVGIVRDVYISK